MDILTAYANLKGWVTAKAGRPDIHRAGNASKSWCLLGGNGPSLLMYYNKFFAHLPKAGYIGPSGRRTLHLM